MEKSFRLWQLGINYLHFAQTAAAELIKNGNANVVVIEDDLSDEESLCLYEERTKWSDFNTAVPLFFLFYHGLELILKGFCKNCNSKRENTHNLSDLLKDFKLFYPESELGMLVGKWVERSKSGPTSVMPINPIAEFFESFKGSVDDFYQALKYPENSSGNVTYQHILLKYKEGLALEFYQSLVQDIENIRCLTVDLGSRIASEE